MKLMVDAEAKKAVQELCDIAVRQGGLNVMNFVLAVLQNTVDIQPTTMPVEPQMPEVRPAGA